MTEISRVTTRFVKLPGQSAPAAGFEAPFEMLATCHQRVERMLTLQARLQQHLLDTGCDEAARQAALDVMRYFDVAAPLHHQDEELHVFPPLLAGSDVGLRKLAMRLIQDHRQMEVAWGEARRVLAAIANSTDSAGSAGSTDRTEFSWTPLTAGQTAALAQFAAMYRQHLDNEDTLAYPAAQATLSPEAVQAMSVDMMQRRGVAPIR